MFDYDAEQITKTKHFFVFDKLPVDMNLLFQIYLFDYNLKRF